MYLQRHGDSGRRLGGGRVTRTQSRLGSAVENKKGRAGMRPGFPIWVPGEWVTVLPTELGDMGGRQSRGGCSVVPWGQLSGEISQQLDLQASGTLEFGTGIGLET